MTGTFDRVSYMRTYNAEYRKKNKDQLRMLNAEYQKKNKDKIKAKKTVYRGRRSSHIASVVRSNKLRNRYGLTTEEYDLMLGIQEGCCAICGNQQEAGRRLHIDHCHETGEVRGLLCLTCNAGLGQFNDDVGRLLEAVKYLKEHDKISRRKRELGWASRGTNQQVNK